MLPGRVSNPGPLTYESGALPIALRGPAIFNADNLNSWGSMEPRLNIISATFTGLSGLETMCK